MKKSISLKVCLPLIVSLLLAACASPTPGAEVQTPGVDYPNPTSYPPPSVGTEPSPDSYAPRPGDESKQRGEVYIDSHEILILESFPPQFLLQVSGSLPTPCHEPRAVVNEPDDQNQIHVEMYSLVDPAMNCIQVLEPFEASIPLGSFSSGSYIVFVNGEQVGEIEP